MVTNKIRVYALIVGCKSIIKSEVSRKMDAREPKMAMISSRLSSSLLQFLRFAKLQRIQCSPKLQLHRNVIIHACRPKRKRHSFWLEDARAVVAAETVSRVTQSRPSRSGIIPSSSYRLETRREFTCFVTGSWRIARDVLTAADFRTWHPRLMKCKDCTFAKGIPTQASVICSRRLLSNL